MAIKEHLRNMTTNVFPSDAASIVFVIILLIWSLSEIVGGVIIPGLRRGGDRVRRRRGITSALIEWMAVFVVSGILATKQIAMLPTWSYYIGITLMLLGIAIRQWAMAVLGRFFSSVLGTQQKHKVIDNGPYHFVRHPSYTGVLLLQLGLGFSVQSWGAILIILLIYGLAFGYRMHVEEKILVAELGESYTLYMRRTKKRLIPFVV
jgi:protein-S-isoprenylcysteine O-methyltransferase Ste14